MRNAPKPAPRKPRVVKFSDQEGKPREEIARGAYRRAFDQIGLAQLLSRVQSLIIANGNELERLIPDLCQDKLIHDLSTFLGNQIGPEGVHVATKKTIKQAGLAGDGIEPDLMVFCRTETEQRCHIVELKDGYEYDTKASAKEIENLKRFADLNRDALAWYQVEWHICGFNAPTTEDVVNGFKRKITAQEAWTGADLCGLLGLDWQAIVQQRQADAEQNTSDFLDDLVADEGLAAELRRRLGGGN